MKRMVLLALLLIASGRPDAAFGQATVEEPEGKIAVTTDSEEARALFLEGRDLGEKLRAADARPLLRQAIEKDPEFAQAYYQLALASASNDEFFENLEKAVANIDGASEGERTMILALEAGVKNQPDRQLELAKELMERFPQDERAHNLLGNLYFGRQEYDEAIEQYRAATEINPSFSPAYNSLGYAARAAGQFDVAEEAFKKYIEVLPDEPNPYDSYAEFLMKQGRFDESIEQYRKALEADPDFVASYVGVANNQMFEGEGEEARATLDELLQIAPDDNVRRQALMWKAASYLHEGNRAKAGEVLRERYALAEKNEDRLAMSNDHNLIGTVMLETGDPGEATSHFDKAIELVGEADVPPEVKAGQERNLLYNQALVALATDDMATAKQKAAAYHEAVEESKVPFEVRQDHELMGRIALAEGRHQEAITHLEQANSQNPRVLYAMAQAYEGMGNQEEATRLAREAAEFNQLNFAYSYVRSDAQAMLND